MGPLHGACHADMPCRPQYTVCTGAGSYADYTASKKEWLAKVTDKFPIEIGGGVPLVSLTALQVGNLAASSIVAISVQHSLPTHREAKVVHATDHWPDKSLQQCCAAREALFDAAESHKVKRRIRESSMFCWSAVQASKIWWCSQAWNARADSGRLQTALAATELLVSVNQIVEPALNLLASMHVAALMPRYCELLRRRWSLGPSSSQARAC